MEFLLRILDWLIYTSAYTWSFGNLFHRDPNKATKAWSRGLDYSEEVIINVGYLHSWLGWGFCILLPSFCLTSVTCTLVESDSMGTFTSVSESHWFQPDSSQHWPECVSLDWVHIPLKCCTKYSFSGMLVGFSARRAVIKQVNEIIVDLHLIWVWSAHRHFIFSQHFWIYLNQKAHSFFECKKI